MCKKIEYIHTLLQNYSTVDMYKNLILGPQKKGTTIFCGKSPDDGTAFTKHVVFMKKGANSSAGSVTFHLQSNATSTLMNELMKTHGIVLETPQPALPSVGGGIPRGE
jgi:hypothetical protein